MKLYEIANDYIKLQEAIENGDIPAEAIADTLESIQAELDYKADNIACMIKNLTAEAEAIKAEETALADRRKIKENEIENIKKYLSDTLQFAGVDKIETARNKITFRKSEKVIIDNETQFIAWAQANDDEYLTYKEPTVNKTALKKALASGETIDGARIESRQNIQIK